MAGPTGIEPVSKTLSHQTALEAALSPGLDPAVMLPLFNLGVYVSYFGVLFCKVVVYHITMCALV